MFRYFPPSTFKTKDCIFAITDLAHHDSSFDLTGRFPHQSSQGNNYVFVCYNYDANAILVEAIPNREAAKSDAAWRKCHRRLTLNGQIVNDYILDNKCFQLLKDAMTKEEVDFELVPPHYHR